MRRKHEIDSLGRKTKGRDSEVDNWDIKSRGNKCSNLPDNDSEREEEIEEGRKFTQNGKDN